VGQTCGGGAVGCGAGGVRDCVVVGAAQGVGREKGGRVKVENIKTLHES